MISKILRSATEALFPPRCYSCRAFIIDSDKHPPHRLPSLDPSKETALKKAFSRLLRPYLCAACHIDFTPVGSPLCPRCGEPFATRSRLDHLCGRCINIPPPYGKARAAGIYKGALHALIHEFKYRGHTSLADPLGSLLYQVFVTWWDGCVIDLVIPVPLHIKKWRQRGFNQAHLMLFAWNRHLPGNAGRGVQIRDDILTRVRWTAPQTGLNRRERLGNIRGAFRIRFPELVKNKRVLLVDDVYTTGATVMECSRVLVAGGARCVDVLTLCRAV